MNFLKRFFNFLLFGNIYVAIGAVCLIQSSLIQIAAHNNLIYYSILTFFSTLFIYNLQRIFYSPQKDNSLLSIRRKWIFENQFTIKTLTIIGLLGVAITFFFNDYRIALYLSPLLLLSIAYFLPAIKLRQNTLFKLLTLAFVWTMVTAVVPLLLTDIPLFSPSGILHFFVRLTFMIAICIPFDIRDMEIDKAENIFTLSQKLGENKTRWIGFGCMLIYILLIVVEFFLDLFSMKIFIALLLTAIVNAIIVFMSSSKRSEYFYTALLDGTMILQGVVVITANNL